MHNEPRELFDVEAVAVFLDVSTRTVWRWVRAGTFPQPVRLSPSTLRWRRRDMLAAIGMNETITGSPAI